MRETERNAQSPGPEATAQHPKGGARAHPHPTPTDRIEPALGICVGLSDGLTLGECDGVTLGATLGATVGDVDGDAVTVSQVCPVALQSGTHT